jgi:hypothetical protein
MPTASLRHGRPRDAVAPGYLGAGQVAEHDVPGDLDPPMPRDAVLTRGGRALPRWGAAAWPSPTAVGSPENTSPSGQSVSKLMLAA